MPGNTHKTTNVRKNMLLRILFFQIILTLLPPLCIDRLWFKRKKSARWLLWSVFLAILAFGLYITLFETYSHKNAHFLGIYLIILLSVCVPSFIFSIFAFGSRLFKKPCIRKSMVAAGATIGIVLFCLIMKGYLFGRKTLVVKETEIVIDNLPDAFDGYRIAQFSDLHLGTYGKDTTFVEQLVKTVNARQPDLIAFTGDLVNYHVNELQPFKHILRRLSAKDGVYSVMGNHDYMGYFHWDSRRQQVKAIQQLQNDETDMGWNLLLNQNAVIHRGTDSLAVIGVENDGKPPFPQLGKLDKAQKGLPKNLDCPILKILLSHDPTHWHRRVLPESDIQLTLSGHTHGTQCSIMGWSPAKLIYKEWGGHYQQGNRHLYVSTGIGQVLIPFRIGIYPQLEIIKIKKHITNI